MQSSELAFLPDREGDVVRDGVRVHYYEFGPADPNAATVVYVHGFNIASPEFVLQVNVLRPRGVRQVLVDLRGHGRSARCVPEQLDIDAAADDIAAVLAARKVRGPVVVVGHSLGGPVSLSLMRRHAGEFAWAGSVQVSSAVEPFTMQGMPRLLAGPAGSALGWVVRHTPHFAEGLRRAITEGLVPVLAVGFYFRPVPWEVIRFHADMIKQTQLPTYEGFFDDLQEHSELGAASVLAGIPGYILVGERDRVTPVSQSRRLWDIWPRAWLQILPESGHMPPLDAPGAVTAAIERLLEKLPR